MAISNFHWFDFFLKAFHVVAVTGALVACLSDYASGDLKLTNISLGSETGAIVRETLWTSNYDAGFCQLDPFYINNSTSAIFTNERVADCSVAMIRILRAFALMAVFSSSIALATSSFGENFPKAFLVNLFFNLVTLGSALTVICVYVIYVDPNRGSIDINWCDSWENFLVFQESETSPPQEVTTTCNYSTAFGFYANFFTAAFSATAFVMAMIGNPKKTTGFATAVRSLKGSIPSSLEPKWGFRTITFWVKLLRFLEFTLIIVACFGEWSRLRLTWNSRLSNYEDQSFFVGLWSGVLCEE